MTAPDAESDSHHDNAEGFMLTRANVLGFKDTIGAMSATAPTFVTRQLLPNHTPTSHQRSRCRV